MLKKLKRFLGAATALTMVFSSFGALHAYADDLAEVSQQPEVSAQSEVSALEGENFSIIEQAADQETAMVRWYPSNKAGAAKYRVSIKSSGGSYKPIDDDLIRCYQGYYRADAVGLVGGVSYTFKVEVLDAAGGTLEELETAAVTPIAHDRDGYAFFDTDYAKGKTEGIGAYKPNGELKDNAQVIYITEQNKDTVTFDVVTDSKGVKTETRKGLLDILLGLKKGYHPYPIAIRFVGRVTDMANIDSDSNFKGDICIDLSKKSTAGITVEGIGDDAVAYGWGLRLKNANNIEVRNLAFMDCDSDEGDDVGLQQTNYNIWVHNCDFFYGEAGSDADQVKGDGSLDCKKSNYVTLSYNHFWDNGKSCLLGLSEKNTELYVTYHHNWFDHSDSRHPRIRYFTTHVYNNFYDGNAKYGVGSTMGSSVFVESNYFKNCKYPMLTSMQGSDIYDTSKNIYDSANMATFSKEDGGTIKAYDNIIEDTGVSGDGIGKYVKRFVTQKDAASLGAGNENQIDAYLASSRTEKVPNTIKSVKGGNTYNNFDTEGPFYDYKLTPVENVPSVVTAYAGRAYRGNFKFTFTDADNELYEVNKELKQAIKNYKGGIVSYGSAHIANSGTIDPADATTTTTEVDLETSSKDTEKPSETTTNKTEGSTQKPSESPSESSSQTSTETTTEATTVQAAGTGKWDFGNGTFSNYEDRDDFVDGSNIGESVVVNGLTIYRPAGGSVAKSTVASDGTPLAGYIKINAKGNSPAEREQITDAFKFDAVKGETIKVYAASNTSGKSATIAIDDVDGNRLKAGSHSSSTNPVDVTEYVVEKSGTFYVYASGSVNANIYKIQLVGADLKDSTGIDEVLVGDVDGDGVLSVNDVMITLDYAINKGAVSAEQEQAIKDAFGSKEVNVDAAKALLEEVLGRK